MPFPPYLEELSMNTIISSSKETDILHTSLELHPTLIQRGWGGHTSILHMPIHSPMGPRPTLAQKKGEGGGMSCLKCPPP